jgi:hypothetical protein
MCEKAEVIHGDEGLLKPYIVGAYQQAQQDQKIQTVNKSLPALVVGSVAILLMGILGVGML